MSSESYGDQDVSFPFECILQNILQEQSFIDRVCSLTPAGIDLLLCHLVELKADESVNQVIEGLTPELRDRRVPFKTICALLK